MFKSEAVNTLVNQLIKYWTLGEMDLEIPQLYLIDTVAVSFSLTQ